jgi:PAS domain S-box-containing protein
MTAEKMIPSKSGDALRQRAEEIAREKAFPMPGHLESLSVEAARQTLHELRVHQIELEMQNEELRRAQAELDASRARYFDLYDLAPVGYCTISEKGLILEANLTAATLLGVTRGALVKQLLTRFILKEDQDIYYRHRKQLFDTSDPQTCELRMVKMGGTIFWTHLAATAAQDADEKPVCRVVMSDINERKSQEDERELTARLVVLLNTPAAFRDLISDLTTSLQGWSGCEAVGIRLRDGNDYPYYETRGFPPRFVQEENRLCAYGQDGEVLRDVIGNPILECMCGNILCGRFDPAKPFFTANGSFWTNGTTSLLAGTTEADRQSRTRNRCNGEGYESVALIPLRAGERVFGLLQFNDHRPDRFTPSLIAHFERMADSLAIALSRRHAVEVLRESQARLDLALWSANMGVWFWNIVEDKRYFDDRVCRLLGINPTIFTGTGEEFYAAVHPDDRGTIKEAMVRTLKQDVLYEPEYRAVWPDGSIHHITARGRLVRDESGRPLRINGIIWDITESKVLAEKIKASLLEKETMLKEIHHRVKNNLQVISSLLDMQSSYLQDEKAKEALWASMARVKTMAMIHTQLYQSADLARVDFGHFIQDLIGNISQSYGRAESLVEINVDADEIHLGIETSIPCGLILNELVANALEHAFPEGKPDTTEGKINITMRPEDNRVVLTVQDNGIGIPESIDVKNLKSLGLDLVNILVGQMNGKIDMQVGGGTTWTITFPVKNEREWRNG